MFIKDNEGTPIALLCINFDDSRYLELSQKLQSIVHPSSFDTCFLQSRETTSAPQEGTFEPHSSITENFPMDIPTLMEKIFDDCICNLETPVDRLNQHERKDIIAKLKEQGLFQLKGAIFFVARKFGCSTATIYRYLSEITS